VAQGGISVFVFTNDLAGGPILAAATAPVSGAAALLIPRHGPALRG